MKKAKIFLIVAYFIFIASFKQTIIYGITLGEAINIAKASNNEIVNFKLCKWDLDCSDGVRGWHICDKWFIDFWSRPEGCEVNCSETDHWYFIIDDDGNIINYQKISGSKGQCLLLSISPSFGIIPLYFSWNFSLECKIKNECLQNIVCKSMSGCRTKWNIFMENNKSWNSTDYINCGSPDKDFTYPVFEIVNDKNKYLINELFRGFNHGNRCSRIAGWIKAETEGCPSNSYWLPVAFQSTMIDFGERAGLDILLNKNSIQYNLKAIDVKITPLEPFNNFEYFGLPFIMQVLIGDEKFDLKWRDWNFESIELSAQKPLYFYQSFEEFLSSINDKKDKVILLESYFPYTDSDRSKTKELMLKENKDSIEIELLDYDENSFYNPGEIINLEVQMCNYADTSWKLTTSGCESMSIDILKFSRFVTYNENLCEMVIEYDFLPKECRFYEKVIKLPDENGKYFIRASLPDKAYQSKLYTLNIGNPATVDITNTYNIYGISKITLLRKKLRLEIKNEGIYRFCLYSLKGGIIFQSRPVSLKSGTQEIELNKTLERGIYFLKILNDKNESYIVKQIKF